MKENTFNLYEEKTINTPAQSGIQPSENSILITVDFSKETFGEMVEKVRTIIEPLPDDLQVNLFMICGYVPHPDAGLFLDWIRSLNRPMQFYFRGIIHLEFLKLLSFLNVNVNEGSKLKFDTKRTHEFQKQLMMFPAVFRNYFQRFIDEYNKLNGELYLDVTEMKTLGFDFKIY